MATSNLGMTKRKSAAKQQSNSRERSLQEIDTLCLSDDLSGQNTSASGCMLNGMESRVAEHCSVFPVSGILDAHCPSLNNIASAAEIAPQTDNSASVVGENLQNIPLSLVPDIGQDCELSRPPISAPQVRSSSEPATASTRGEIRNHVFAPNQIPPLLTCTHPESTIESNVRTPSRYFDEHNHGPSHQVSAEILDETTLATQTYSQAFHDPTARQPSTTLLLTICRTVSKEMEEIYQDTNTISIMSSIIERSVKYHEETADFKDGDCLVKKIVKGMNAIMKPPEDLRGRFDLSKIRKVKDELKKEQAGLESLQTISLWNETFRYDYVMKIAETRMSLYCIENPNTPIHSRQAQAQAEAVKELVNVVSKGRSDENYRKHEQFWKFLYDLRIEGTINEVEDDSTARMVKEGMTDILLFRTGSFKRRFFNKTKDSLQTVRKWNQIYNPYMKEVKMRVLAERHDDSSSISDLHQLEVWKALKSAQSDWVNGIQDLSQEEQQLYLTDLHCASTSEELSSQSTKDVLRDGIIGDSDHNKAIFICLVPYEGAPNGKRRIDGTPASRTVVAPCPIVPISPGDFLGVMSGKLRYTSEVGRSNNAIQGPYPKLWLDFSKITGKLSCMKAAESANEPNVTLTWKRYDSESGVDWRVDIVATKEIWPFEELVRLAQ
jgi:hypothetical protein